MSLGRTQEAKEEEQEEGKRKESQETQSVPLITIGNSFSKLEDFLSHSFNNYFL